MASLTLNEEKIAALLRDYSTPESWVNRQLGAQLAAQSNCDRYIPTLFLLLEDRHEWVRFHALCALHNLQPDPVAFKSALTALQIDPFFRTRAKVREILADMGQRSHQEGIPQAISNG